MNKNNFRNLIATALAAALLAGCASNKTDDTSGSQAGSDPYGASGYQSGSATAYDQASADAAALASLQRVFYFDFDKSELRPEVQAELDKYVNILRNSNQSIRLEGHADERGTTEYNLALGERRANSVAQYLLVNGVSRDRIEVVSYGEERPAAIGHDDAAHAQNRRVEVILR
ncbi:MAG: peptidoglycan-associated lipoprotein Pal [Spongiibacteraceae bacterium]|jgi:peptidoglycan-associated lipoprotein|nr:peptidoglycan-associated lipoprotein Pal [Spongiibacteraceae bacterium]